MTRLEEIQTRFSAITKPRDGSNQWNWAKPPLETSKLVSILIRAGTIDPATSPGRVIPDADAEFIQHAPADIAWLLEAVELLRKLEWVGDPVMTVIHGGPLKCGICGEPYDYGHAGDCLLAEVLYGQ